MEKYILENVSFENKINLINLSDSLIFFHKTFKV